MSRTDTYLTTVIYQSSAKKHDEITNSHSDNFIVIKGSGESSNKTGDVGKYDERLDLCEDHGNQLNKDYIDTVKYNEITSNSKHENDSVETVDKTSADKSNYITPDDKSESDTVYENILDITGGKRITDPASLRKTDGNAKSLNNEETTSARSATDSHNIWCGNKRVENVENSDDYENIDKNVFDSRSEETNSSFQETIYVNDPSFKAGDENTNNTNGISGEKETIGLFDSNGNPGAGESSQLTEDYCNIGTFSQKEDEEQTPAKYKTEHDAIPKSFNEDENAECNVTMKSVDDKNYQLYHDECKADQSQENRYIVHIVRCPLKAGVQFGDYCLEIADDRLKLLDISSDKQYLCWPYNAIRRFGMIKNKTQFCFEAGRRCESGEGQFVFNTDFAEKIYQSSLTACQYNLEKHHPNHK